MEMQSCRKQGIMDVGFMDPMQINEANVDDQATYTVFHLYKFLDRQQDKTMILLLYNC